MQARPGLDLTQIDLPVEVTQVEESHHTYEDGIFNFDPSTTCLFCSQTQPSSLPQNLSHMSTSHSFHIQTASLLIDLTTLLAHFHSVITELRECLYCRKQLRSSEAVRRHMVDKGHCMYDASADGGAFYGAMDGLVSLEELQTTRRRMIASSTYSSRRRDRDGGASRSAATAAAGMEESMSDISSMRDFGSKSSDQGEATDNNHYHNDGPDNADVSNSPTTSQQLITSPTPRSRSRRQTSTSTTQLSHLRENDRRSLQHLPTSQQRALLATHHKQTEKSGRATNARRGALESAGNYFGRLGTVRLIRQPPHTGRVQSLKH